MLLCAIAIASSNALIVLSNRRIGFCEGSVSEMLLYELDD
jgi:hypothetical protein